jgi:pimeloyl-ACP methyl ester carboxylesterase
MELRLLLLPGMDGTGELFRALVAEFPKTWDQVIVRYPTGERQSYTELMMLLQAAAESSEHLVVVAESFSTPLAIAYAAMRPQQLRGLVLCAGFASSPAWGWRRLMGMLLAPAFFRLALPKFGVERFLVGSAATDSLIESVRSAISSVRANVLLGRLKDVFACDVRTELGQVKVPMLYIRAMQDRLIPVRCVEEILRIRPETTVVEIAGPHLILQREPQSTAAIVARFIAETQAHRQSSLESR